MISLKQLVEKTPKSWYSPMNPNDSWDLVNGKIEKFGIVNEDNRERYEPLLKGVSIFVRYVWPSVDLTTLALGTQFSIFLRIFDDNIDTSEPEYAIKHINRVINIIKFGKLEEDPTPIERNLFDLNQNLDDRFGEKLALINLFRNSLLDYFDNLLAWQNMKKLKGDLSMNLYYTLRRYNYAMIPSFFITLIFTMKRLKCEIILDPLWKTIVELSGNICAIYNDVLSYEKEMKENDERMNSFHFMKTQNNWSNQECLEFFEKEIGNCFEQLSIHEKLATQKFIPRLNKEDQEEFYQIINNLHTLIHAILSMYLTKPSYKSTNSIFVELRI
ncbi:hypothetical protein PPL_08182 [Heterostelium album PN500]|uniref:Terpene synthase n=1 Tax=Heterostelium pallidum (strain ATCC 26659 / Pp 5 / PN500) TaxID=670386 RepID=D3BIU7_HETP5|nr:hypothetical protein PPL_08182 [Heterostelium album PN500]EFA78721.1 hypothetical protein PPL_08182 [Heterostelium album PN500]|eukprot:XP_020430845.1 hypothetical protein PPL_08182 [Heterostelium album PN500]